PVFLLELLEQGLDFGGIFGKGCELAAQFVAGMFTPRQITYGPGLQTRPGSFACAGLVAGRHGFEIVFPGGHGAHSAVPGTSTGGGPGKQPRAYSVYASSAAWATLPALPA